MKNENFIRSVLAVLLMLFVAAPLMAEDDSTTNLNHLSLSMRAGFNITGRFKNLGTLTLPPSARTTPNGDPYNYDNGYVYTDVSGNAGGQTWYWGYDAPSQISGNTILMSRTAPGANAASPDGINGSDPNLGWELTYDRELGRIGEWRYGLEAAINYTRLSFSDNSSFTGTVNQTTDAYPFTPGTTPPVSPYQGTFNGPGFLLGSTPVSSTTTVIGTSTIVGSRQFSSDVWGMRLGPYLEYPLTEQLDISVSAGLAGGLLFNSASWNETIYVGAVPSGVSTGSGNSVGAVWGGYASAQLDWEFTKHWSAAGGVQFQDLGIYQQNVGSREIELDLNKSIFVTLGIECKF